MSELSKIIIKAVVVFLLAALFTVSASLAKTSFDLLNPSLASPHIANSTSNSSQSEYILPDSDKRYYTYSELNELTDEQLNFAHNEIYARHGRIFNDKRYADHFAACSWYKPRYSPEEYDAMPNQLNGFEKANSDLMAQIRSERGIK